MNKEILQDVVDALAKKRKVRQVDEAQLKDQIGAPVPISKQNNRAYAYSYRHRGQWFRGEYDFEEIQQAQDTDSYMFRAIKKKKDRLLTAGWEFVGKNKEAVSYVLKRIRHIELATDRPFAIQIIETAADLIRYSNCMWVKVRDRDISMAKRRTINIAYGNKRLDPVAGYFILPFETLEFKTRPNGELKKIKQHLRNGEKKEFQPYDVIHFYDNHKPGFSVGTPEMYPALDDIALLRRIEENVEELIESSLFPVFHYKIGTDDFPERITQGGRKESEVVREKIEYMPAGSIYISDHRHEIIPMGAEGNALRIDFYLEYFKKRVFAALGTTSVDMGEGTGATRSTASTMSKSMMLDVEALQSIMKIFIDHYVITELLIEGGFDPLSEEDRVKVKFGVVDKDDRRADENQQIQLFANKVTTQDETRRALGMQPMEQEDQDNTYYKLYEEPLALVKSMGPGAAAGETLAGSETSNVTPESVEEEKKFAKTMEKTKRAGQAGNQGSSSSSGQRRASSSRSRPSNQHGTRSSPKTTRDYPFEHEGRKVYVRVPDSTSDEEIQSLIDRAKKRYGTLANKGISFGTVLESMLWRLDPEED